jgi:carbonic anhydrase
MEKSFTKILNGYKAFRKKYAQVDQSVMQYLSRNGQQPEVMVVACCDSRVDPGLILQSEPGDLFVVRNVANIVPPYEKDTLHHGTSAALEFGVRFLKVKHLILLGHSQCGGIQALLGEHSHHNDFISNWVSVIKTKSCDLKDVDGCAKMALQESYENCMSFPWICSAIEQKMLLIHLWFFDIKSGQIFAYHRTEKIYKPLDNEHGFA